VAPANGCTIAHTCDSLPDLYACNLLYHTYYTTYKSTKIPRHIALPRSPLDLPSLHTFKPSPVEVLTLYRIEHAGQVRQILNSRCVELSTHHTTEKSTNIPRHIALPDRRLNNHLFTSKAFPSRSIVIVYNRACRSSSTILGNTTRRTLDSVLQTYALHTLS
jgi:hypothetical protein